MYHVETPVLDQQGPPFFCCPEKASNQQIMRNRKNNLCVRLVGASSVCFKENGSLETEECVFIGKLVHTSVLDQEGPPVLFSGKTV